MKSFVPVLLLGAMSLIGIAGYAFLRAPAPPSTASPAAPSESAGVQSASQGAEPSADATVFQIVPGQTQARFVTNEILRGAPNEVIGVTNDVSGQIAANPTDPDTAQVGTIRINARTLATDSDQRNRAMQRFILGTDQHEFITFTPTAVRGLPDVGNLGQPHSFQIDGQLTIRDVTRDVVFDATVTPRDTNLIAGEAATVVNYADWGLSIPSVPFVASVDPQVRLELTFVASASA